MNETTKETEFPVIELTDATFADAIERTRGLAVVDFWAAWCGPCRMVAPILEAIAGEYAGRVKVAKLDIDANPETARRFNVRSIPTLLFFRDGQLVDTVVGALPKSAVSERLSRLLSRAA